MLDLTYLCNEAHTPLLDLLTYINKVLVTAELLLLESDDFNTHYDAYEHIWYGYQQQFCQPYDIKYNYYLSIWSIIDLSMML